MSDLTTNTTQAEPQSSETLDISSIIRDVIILSGIDYDKLNQTQQDIAVLNVANMMDEYINEFVEKHSDNKVKIKFKAIVASGFNKKIIEKNRIVFDLIALGLSSFVQSLLDNYQTESSIEEALLAITKNLD